MKRTIDVFIFDFRVAVVEVRVGQGDAMLACPCEDLTSTDCGLSIGPQATADPSETVQP